jgi:hypothetical protein
MFVRGASQRNSYRMLTDVPSCLSYQSTRGFQMPFYSLNTTSMHDFLVEAKPQRK